MRYSYVLFDLDGTLLDTNELIFRSFEHTFQVHKLENFTRADILAKFGRALEEQMEEYAPGKAQELVQTYRKYNFEQHDALVQAFPHVEEVLRQLHEAGVKLAVVTSKIRKTTLMGLELCGLSAYFDALITADDTTRHKPHPEPVRKALDVLGADPARTLMVGDSPFDIRAGKAAGVATAGVKWSLRGEEELRDCAADYLVADMRELSALVLGTRN